MFKPEVMAMVPIMRLRKTKRTVGVNQLFTEAQIEGRDDTDSSNMACLCQADTKTGVENGDLKIRTRERERERV